MISKECEILGIFWPNPLINKIHDLRTQCSARLTCAIIALQYDNHKNRTTLKVDTVMVYFSMETRPFPLLIALSCHSTYHLQLQHAVCINVFKQ